MADRATMNQERLWRALRVIPEFDELVGALIARVRKHPLAGIDEVRDADRIQSCASALWIVADAEEEIIRFRPYCSNDVVLGLAGLMCEIYDCATVSSILKTEPWIFEKLGILQNLTPLRRAAISEMRQLILQRARRE